MPRVDKIVGTGQPYVAAAKALVAADCAIDFYAGPTEIVIVSDNGNPEWIAADLIAQAEHDPQARAILITTSRALARKVARAVASADAADRSGARIPRAPRRHHRRRQIAKTRSRWPIAPPPEHLVCDDDRIRRCGAAARARSSSGSYTAQVAGDYAIGSNHVLPTNGAARFRGGLHASDFVRDFDDPADDAAGAWTASRRP